MCFFFKIPTKYCPCPEGSGSLGGKTKFTQWKQLTFTLVNTSLHMLHLTLNLGFFPLCFWFSHSATCAHLLHILWKGTAVTSMLSLKAFFHSFRRFRVSPSLPPTGGCLHHFFTSFAVGFVGVICSLDQSLVLSQFFFSSQILPTSTLSLPLAASPYITTFVISITLNGCICSYSLGFYSHLTLTHVFIILVRGTPGA